MSRDFYISLGGGVRLLSEDWYLLELPGLTKRGFRSLCKALSVPMIEISSTRYVEATSFLLAMRAITRIGEPNFLAPGSETLRKNNKKDEITELDYKKFQKNFEVIVAELLAAKKVQSGTVHLDIKEAAKKAASRMVRAGLQFLPSREQQRYDRGALKAYGQEENGNQEEG